MQASARGADELLRLVACDPSSEELPLKQHLELIYAKLGVEDRAAAAGIAIRTAGGL